MKVQVICGRELTEQLSRTWSQIQQADASLGSPYFCPQFTRSVASVINSGTFAMLENSKEVEGFINELPGVAESALVGVPHPDFGEVGVAVVVPRPGAALEPQAVVDALKGQLANFKIPKRCFVVQELPRNTMGKVQKNVLRDTYKDIYAKK